MYFCKLPDPDPEDRLVGRSDLLEALLPRVLPSGWPASALHAAGNDSSASAAAAAGAETYHKPLWLVGDQGMGKSSLAKALAYAEFIKFHSEFMSHGLHDLSR